jgi:hypothetical protein
VAGFLAGYGGSTRVSYATDLRLFAVWCHEAKQPVHRPPGAPGAVRTMVGGDRPDALDGRSAAVDAGQLLQVRRAGGSRGPEPGAQRPKAES